MKVLSFILAVILMVEAAALFTYKDVDEKIELPKISFDHIVDKGARDTLAQLYQHALKEYKKSNDLAKLVRVADLLLCYGYNEEAAHIYYAILSKDSEQERAWQGLALCYDSLGQFENAILAYTEVLKQNLQESDLREIKHRIAEVTQIQGRPSEAMQLYEQNIEHSPSRYRYIRLVLHAGDFNLAQKEFALLLNDSEAHDAIEVQQLNDLSLRLHGKYMQEIAINQRDSLWSYQPIDKFKRSLESFYGMSLMELFTPALREMPQITEDPIFMNDIDFWGLLKKKDIINSGKEVFEKHNCIICHGKEGYGQVGPNLRDDFWLGFGSPGGIYDTITYGRSNGTMPGHQFSLHPDQIRDVTVYIMDLNLKTEKYEGRTKQGKAHEGKLDPLSKYRK